MAEQVFVGVFLAGIALMLIYWLFNSFGMLTLAIIGGVLWLVIYLLTKERLTKKEREERKTWEKKKYEAAAELERLRIKNLSGFAKFSHHMGTIFLWTVGTLIFLGALAEFVSWLR